MKKGFTLIELLVVVSIISLLSSIVMASLQSARIKAENSLTIQTVRQYINALELYAADNDGKYPNPASGRYDACLGYDNDESCLSWHGNQELNTALEPYINIKASKIEQKYVTGARGVVYSNSTRAGDPSAYLLRYSLISSNPNVVRDCVLPNTYVCLGSTCSFNASFGEIQCYYSNGGKKQNIAPNDFWQPSPYKY